MGADIGGVLGYWGAPSFWGCEPRRNHRWRRLGDRPGELGRRLYGPGESCGPGHSRLPGTCHRQVALLRRMSEFVEGFSSRMALAR